MNNEPDSPPHQELLGLVVEVWKTSVDVQKHFNEVSTKTRQLGLSFVVGALGLAAVLLSKVEEPPVLSLQFGQHSIQVHAAPLVVMLAALALVAIRRLDLTVYHQMLRGAVRFTEELERKQLRGSLLKTRLGLAESVSESSRSGKGADAIRTAGEKISSFYFWSILALAAISLVLFLST